MHDILGGPGPWPWFVSRAFGAVAYTALTIEILLGLGGSTGYLDRSLGRARAVEIHRWLSAIVIGSFVLHAVVLLADRTVGLSVIDLVVPFRGPYRPAIVGAGIMAAYALVTIHVSHLLRKRIGARGWRRLHYLSFPAFVLASLHGILAGTDTSRLGFRAMYIGAALLVSVLTFLRLFQVVVRLRAERDPAPRSSAV